MIWEYVLHDTVACLPSTGIKNLGVGRDAYLAPLYVSKGTRAETLHMVFENLIFDLCFLVTPFAQLQHGLDWPSLRFVKSIIIKPEQVDMYERHSQQAPFVFPHLDILTLFWTPEDADNLRPLAAALGDATGDIRRHGVFACLKLAMGSGSHELDRIIGILRRCNLVRSQAVSVQAVELRIEIPHAVDATLTVKDPYSEADWGLLRETERVETQELPSAMAFHIWRMTGPAASDMNPAVFSTFERMRIGLEMASSAYHAHQVWLARWMQHNALNGIQQ